MPTLAEIAESVARRFVHTVVLVDDRAFDSNHEGDHPTPLVPPGRASIAVPTLALANGEGTKAAAAPISTEAAGKEPAVPIPATTANAPAIAKALPAPASEPDALDAPTLIKTFASAGLVCAVIAPVPHEEVVAETAAAARRSDIVVVDWVLHDSHGDIAMDVVCKILEGDKSAGGRLRLIAIYTGEASLREIIDKLAVRVGAYAEGIEKSESGLQLTWRGASIVVLAKRDAPMAAEDVEAEKHRVPAEELPERLIREFSQLTRGLVCGVAVRSLADVRDQTHALINNLGPHVDPAFLTHRALLPAPDDATGHALEVVADEVASLIQSCDADGLCGQEPVRATVQGLQHDPSTALTALKWSPATRDEAVNLAIGGFKGRKSPSVDKLDSVARVFSPTDAAARRSEAEYAVAATLVRRHVAMKPPMLTLGAILMRPVAAATPPTPPEGAIAQGVVANAPTVGEAPSEYLVCIQPRCDSVRIEPPNRSFLFLPARKDGDHYQIIVKEGEEFTTLNVDEGAQYVEAIRFAPAAEDKVVRATREGAIFRFAEADPGTRKFVWIGQLKWSHAQRIANRFAEIAARVGLDEPEYLRRRR